jgi:hypothetical protein
VAERQDSDREVLTSLPRSRPVRRSAKRGDRADANNGAASAPSRRASAAKPTTAKTPAKATTAKAKPAATAGTRRTASEQPRAAPRRTVPPAGYAAPTSRGDDGTGTADLLSTTIQAAAELAQIGLTVGRQTLQSMIDRLPKP